MSGPILIGTALLSAGYVFVTNWLALIPWRRNKEKHWSEQARLVYPILVDSRSALFFVPLNFALAVALIWPEKSYLWLFTAVFTLATCSFATIPFYREILPRIALPALFRLTVVDCLLNIIVRTVFIWAAFAMPPQFNIKAIAAGGTLFALWLIWAQGGMIRLGLRLKFFDPAPARLRLIAETAASKMNVSYRDVLLLRLPTAQAFAMPHTGHLLFTERLLELLTDEELAAVCAHELAHLTESKQHRLWRLLFAPLVWLPWVFFNPLSHVLGIGAVILLSANMLVWPFIYRRLSQRLEVRADTVATANQINEGCYAQALLKIYRDGYLPAVNAKNTATHPHLYDRIIASGIMPDFPRPLPPNPISWGGLVTSMITGILFLLFSTRFIDSIRGSHLFH